MALNTKAQKISDYTCEVCKHNFGVNSSIIISGLEEYVA